VISELQLRRAMLEDWEQILPLLRSMKIDSEQEVKRRFGDLIHRPDHYLPMALADAHLIGYGWVQDYGAHLRAGFRTARLHDLFVLPTYRRLGIGATLFHAVKGWAQQGGIRYLEWQASQSALGFYQRLGYIGDPCPQPEYPFFEIDFTS
jgi:GNAT superfamily N-acetyltransferase